MAIRKNYFAKLKSDMKKVYNISHHGQLLDGSITFAEFIDRWMTEYAEKQLAPKTY